MRIVVASGKGGTGKTTVAVNLAYSLSTTQPVTLADCDVEEPNLHLFFPALDDQEQVTIDIPRIDPSVCTLCGKCGLFCRYGAIIVIRDQVLQYPQLCHSCGGCTLVCPVGAISEYPVPVGHLHSSVPQLNLHFVSGTLCEGSIHTTTVIKAVRRRLEHCSPVILDGPPGTACAAMETLEGCDFCLLVTEPTMFGLHDLTLINEVAKILHIPVGVVLNRCDTLDTPVDEFCKNEQIPIMMRIPFDRTIALHQGSGRIISREDSGWCEKFLALFNECLIRAGES